MIIDDPSATPPKKILAFDSAKARSADAVPVDLDTPFFTITHTPYPACNHRDRGVDLDIATRRAICKCGEVIDNFDALLIYAHAQHRLVQTKQYIEEHKRKEAEKKAARAYVKEVGAYAMRVSSRGRRLGYDVTLACGHKAAWYGKRVPRRMTCQQCIRVAKLAAQGVVSAPGTAQP